MTMDNETLFRAYLRGAAGGYSEAPDAPLELLGTAAIGARDVRHGKTFRTREGVLEQVKAVLGPRAEAPVGGGAGPMSAGKRRGPKPARSCYSG